MSLFMLCDAKRGTQNYNFHYTILILKQCPNNFIIMWTEKWLCPSDFLKHQNVINFSFFLLPKNLLKFNLCCFFRRWTAWAEDWDQGNKPLTSSTCISFPPELPLTPALFNNH